MSLLNIFLSKCDLIKNQIKSYRFWVIQNCSGQRFYERIRVNLIENGMSGAIGNGCKCILRHKRNISSRQAGRKYQLVLILHGN